MANELGGDDEEIGAISTDFKLISGLTFVYFADLEALANELGGDEEDDELEAMAALLDD